MRVRPDDPPPPTLALVAAVALHETASLHAPGLQIKWPNDLLAFPPRNGEGDHPKGDGGVGAKLAGILLEREGESVVVGFGVNLAAHPRLADRPATSLAALAGAAPEPAPFLEQLAEAFARWLARWRREGLAPIRRRWLEAAHPVGTALSTEAGDGLFDGLDESGALRLRLADGTVRLIHAGDIFLI